MRDANGRALAYVYTRREAQKPAKRIEVKAA